MTKKDKDKFPWKKSKYTLERVLEVFFWEWYLLIRTVKTYIGRKPKDNFEKMMKFIEIMVWLFLSYDILRSLILPRW